MSEFQRLFEEDRSSRRTIADAIEVLRQACDFNSHDRAEIRIGPLPLPSGDVVGLVNVQFPVRDTVFIVSLPAAATVSSAVVSAVMAVRWSRMISISSTNATTKRVSDTDIHHWLNLCVMPARTAPKMRVSRAAIE